MKIYAELIGNNKKLWIKSYNDNKMDYRGEIIVALYNDSSVERTVCDGDRIAQLVIHRVEPAIFEEIDSLTDTERGTGGFGSTGTR